MGKIHYKFSLDAHRGGRQKTLQGLHVGERLGRVFDITLNSGTVPVDLDGMMAVMYVRKPGVDEISVNTCTINGSVITYEVAPADLAAEGTVQYQIEIIAVMEDGTDQVIYAPRFDADVIDDSIIDSSDAEQTAEFTALETALAQAQHYRDKSIEDIYINDENALVIEYFDGTSYESESLVARAVVNIGIERGDTVDLSYNFSELLSKIFEGQCIFAIGTIPLTPKKVAHIENGIYEIVAIEFSYIERTDTGFNTTIIKVGYDNQVEKRTESFSIDESLENVGAAADAAAVGTALAKKTEKVRIDFDGTSFTIGGSVISYQQLYEAHIPSPDFAFVVYGDRAYLLSYVQDGAGMKEMRFQSVLAVTDASGLSNVKTSGIYVTSTDGINIASVRVTDINSENKAYKAAEFTDENRDSEIWYPSNKAVNKELTDLKEELNNKLDKATADTLYAPIGSTGGNGGSATIPTGLLTDLQKIFRAIPYYMEDVSNEIRGLVKYANGGSDSPVNPPEDEEPEEPTRNPVSVAWSGTVATINDLINLTVDYTGTVANVGV